MTWAKVDDRFHQDPQLLRLPRGVRLLYIEGLTYCAQQLTDGFIADYMLRKITDEPDAELAAQTLVDSRLWEPSKLEQDAGWQVVDYLKTQSSRQDVKDARDLSAQTTARSRKHKAGDHSLCFKGTYCPQGAVTRHNTSHTTRQSSSQSGPLDPTLSSPTPREERKGSGTTSPAPLRSPGRVPSSKGFTFTMPEPVADDTATGASA